MTQDTVSRRRALSLLGATAASAAIGPPSSAVAQATGSAAGSVSTLGGQAPQAAPTWTSIGPGGGGWVMTLAASPHKADTVFLGGDTEGIFHSDDAGKSWAIRNEGLHDYWIEAILYHPRDPNIIYVGGKSGVYQSIDQGRSWRWLRSGFRAVSSSGYSAPVSALTMDPTDASVIYAGIGSPRDGIGKDGAVYRTVDGGATWAKVNAGGGLPSDALITSLQFQPASKTLYLSSQYGVFLSSDGGVNWTTANTGLPHTNVASVAFSRSKPAVIYLTLYTASTAPWRGGVYASDNGGKTWTARNGGLQQLLGADANLTSNYRQLVVDPANPNVVYVGSTDYRSHTMYKTTDGGLNWTPIVAWPPASGVAGGWVGTLSHNVQALAMSPVSPGVLYYGSGMTVFRTADGGRTWQQVYTRENPDGTSRTIGLEATLTHFVLIDPRNTRRVFFGYQDIGLFLSLDGGVSVQRKAGNLAYPTPASTAYAVALDPTDPNHLWGSFGPWETRPPGFVIAETIDLGRTWIVRKEGLPDRPFKRMLLDDSAQPRRLLVTVADNGIYKSDDGGKNWSSSSSGLAHGDVRDLVTDPSRPGTYWTVLAGKDASAGIIYRSNDRGANWQRISGPSLLAWDIKKLAVSEVLYVAARRIFVGGRLFAGGIYSSDDGGVIWKQVLEDQFAQVVVVDPNDPKVVYAGLTQHPYYDDSRGNGLKVSRDGGATWTEIAVIPQKRVTVLALDPRDPTRLFVGTAGNGFGVVQPVGAIR